MQTPLVDVAGRIRSAGRRIWERNSYASEPCSPRLDSIILEIARDCRPVLLVTNLSAGVWLGI